jgi:hypothetical protein
MTSERQRAANRANARKSSGPRSPSGKQRASRNARKHGLGTPISGAAFARDVEAIARQIAGNPEDRLRMALARDAAEAQLELARVLRLAVALIERVATFGRLEERKLFRTAKQEAAWMALFLLGAETGQDTAEMCGRPIAGDADRGASAHRGSRPKRAARPRPPQPLRAPCRRAQTRRCSALTQSED